MTKSKDQEALNIINKIKKHHLTTKILYPEYKEAFEYVDELFPDCNVKEVVIFKTKDSVFEKYNINAAGFYCILDKSVVVTNTKKVSRTNPNAVIANVSIDEAIVHELLHYCFYERKLNSISKFYCEEFAYGWSLKYLRDKGYSDEQVINNNYLPFLYSECKNDIVAGILSSENINIEQMTKYQYSNFMNLRKKEIHGKVINKCVEIGNNIIKIYNNKIYKPLGSAENKIKEETETYIDFSADFS